MGSGNEQRDRRGDALVAIVLALVLSVGWSVRDWHALSALRLPDTDDVMRLQQIRDWLAGQRFADLSQHRLAGGLPMHWSRLPDLVPGTIITALAPMVGRHGAEVAAVIVWPAMLLAAALYAVARIARSVAGADSAFAATVVAAIAYPVTTIFLPGRIDHHGLQVVLLLIVIATLMHLPTLGRGLIAGLAAAASLAIGMETVPLLVAGAGVMAVEWFAGRRCSCDRLMGFGIAFTAALLGVSTGLHSDQWTYAACDGPTAMVWQAAVVAGFAPVLLALLARDGATVRTRVFALLAAGAVAVGAVSRFAPACLSPYGAVDPLLARLWLGRVGEAQPLLDAPLPVAIGYAGVMFAGIAAAAWRLAVTRDTRWTALLAVQIAAFALTFVQLRGAYAGAVLAAPALGAVIAAARARGTLPLAAAWLGSAGMLYPLAAQAMMPTGMQGPAAHRSTLDCTAPEALADLAALPPGRLLAPLDLGAFALGATRLEVVGAPYHRNNAGNLAVYRFFLGDADPAKAIARRWQVRYVALCDQSFVELHEDEVPRGAMLRALRAGRAPRWLTRAYDRHGMALYTVDPRG